MFPRDIDQQRELIYNEQVKTNELLTQLIALQSKPETKTTVTKPTNTRNTTKKPRGKAK